MATVAGKYAFRPGKIKVRPGTTVVWVNNSNADHTVTAASGVWSSTDVSHGRSYKRTFVQPGRYEYVCGLHGYMTGVVIVR